MAIAHVLGVGTATVELVRRRCVLDGLDAALERKDQANRRPKVRDGAGEAKRVMLACSDPPSGSAAWTLRLLGDKMVERAIVDSISTETIRRTLKKTKESLGTRSAGVFPRKRMILLLVPWRMFSTPIKGSRTMTRFWSVSTRPPSNRPGRPGHPVPRNRGIPPSLMMNRKETAPPTCSCPMSPLRGGDLSRSPTVEPNRIVPIS